MNTLFIAQNRIHLSETASTNNYASELLRRRKVPEGTVITAGRQTEGRGQRGKQWQSEPGKNLLMSCILYPSFLRMADRFLLNKAVALTVLQASQEIQPDLPLAIKWPNDILAGNRKLSGILIENTISGSQIVSCVAGIGINVNQRDFPEGLGKPVSFIRLSGKETGIDTVLEILCKQLESHYLQLKAGKYRQLEQAYSAALWKKNESVNFRVNGEEFAAELLDVDQEGRLLILPAGKSEIKAFHHGELEWMT